MIIRLLHKERNEVLFTFATHDVITQKYGYEKNLLIGYPKLVEQENVFRLRGVVGFFEKINFKEITYTGFRSDSIYVDTQFNQPQIYSWTFDNIFQASGLYSPNARLADYFNADKIYNLQVETPSGIFTKNAVRLLPESSLEDGNLIFETTEWNDWYLESSTTVEFYPKKSEGGSDLLPMKLPRELLGSKNYTHREQVDVLQRTMPVYVFTADSYCKFNFLVIRRDLINGTSPVVTFELGDVKEIKLDTNDNSVYYDGVFQEKISGNFTLTERRNDIDISWSSMEDITSENFKVEVLAYDTVEVIS